MGGRTSRDMQHSANNALHTHTHDIDMNLGKMNLINVVLQDEKTHPYNAYSSNIERLKRPAYAILMIVDHLNYTILTSDLVSKPRPHEC